MFFYDKLYRMALAAEMHSPNEDWDAVAEELIQLIEEAKSTMDCNQRIIAGMVKQIDDLQQPPQWSTEWPTEPGHYWFVLKGYSKPCFAEVVSSTQGGLLYFGRYGEIAKQPAAWLPAQLPDIAPAERKIQAIGEEQ